MWMLGEKEEDDPSRVDTQAADIADKDFTGVLVFPRAGKLDLRHPEMIDLLERASNAANTNGLDVWLLADPRLASRSLIEESGEALEVLIINKTPDDFWNGSNLNSVRIEGCKFRWEMEYPELRPTHMLQEGGITYYPIGLEKVYLFKRGDDGGIADIKDITEFVDWQHDENNRKVIVNCEVDESLNGYEVLAFPKFRTNFLDYTGIKTWELWIKTIDELFERIECISGICWDEPGFYCEFGKFPYTKHICNHFKKSYGYDLPERLAWLVLDSPDESHAMVRNGYYQLLNNVISSTMDLNWSVSSRAAVNNERMGSIQSGIHATWHGEFCGLEEMVHGSMDLWHLRKFQSAAFTDIGEAERLLNPGTCPDIIYSLVLARSLSKVGPNRGIIYSNCWGINFGKPGDEASGEIMDYWRDLLDMFGARWLAHGYGWPGTRFTDLNFGPGYPDHPTWERFSLLNQHTKGAGDTFEVGEPVTDVLMVYPLENFYAIGHAGGNRVGVQLVKLVDLLTRRGYQLDIISSEWLMDANIYDGRIVLNGCEYNSLLVTHGRYMTQGLRDFIVQAKDAGVTVVENILSYDDLTPFGTALPKFDEISDDQMERMYEKISDAVPPTFELPDGAIGNIRKDDDGYIVHMIADRPNGRCGGTFKYSGVEVKIEERQEPLTIRLEVEGE